MTSEELWNLPDDGQRHELWAGRLLSEPPPGFEHGEILNEIGRLLKNHVLAHSLGRVVAGDVGFVLARNPDTVRAPDVAFVQQERLPHGRLQRYFDGAPDLAVEVLSPGDRPGAVAAKVADYLSAGARAVWVVDPDERSVTLFSAGAPARSLSESDEVTEDELLPGFRVAVADLFR